MEILNAYADASEYLSVCSKKKTRKAAEEFSSVSKKALFKVDIHTESLIILENNAALEDEED